MCYLIVALVNIIKFEFGNRHSKLNNFINLIKFGIIALLPISIIDLNKSLNNFYYKFIKY